MEAEVGIVGLGAMGSMALWHLAVRGVPTLGIERHFPGHALGSSHGESRIFRTAYAEGPEYVPLLRAALTQWRELERQTAGDLLHLTGGLMIGRSDSGLIGGVLASAREHDLEHRVLDSADLRRIHPQHVTDPDDVGIHEADAGLLRPEAAVAAAADRASALGATVLAETEAVSLEPDADGVGIVCAGGEHHRVGRAVLSAGAWTSSLLPSGILPLAVERNVQVWFELEDAASFAPQQFPVFIRELPGEESVPYGFPTTDGRTIKLALHHSGEPADPDTVDRETRPEDVGRLQTFVRQRLRGVSQSAVRGRVCVYTNTPDEGFAIGRLDGLPNVVVVSACSGHGFKFAPVIGEIAADLATTGETRHDIGRFAPQRFTTKAGSPGTEHQRAAQQ